MKETRNHVNETVDWLYEVCQVVCCMSYSHNMSFKISHNVGQLLRFTALSKLTAFYRPLLKWQFNLMRDFIGYVQSKRKVCKQTYGLSVGCFALSFKVGGIFRAKGLIWNRISLLTKINFHNNCSMPFFRRHVYKDKA